LRRVGETYWMDVVVELGAELWLMKWEFRN
jgi:hypothetical protein